MCAKIRQMIKDVYPTKGQFHKEEDVAVVVEFDKWIIEQLNSRPRELEIIVTHFDEKVFNKKYALELCLESAEFTMKPFECGGYGVVIKCGDMCAKTAFDVAENHYLIPRYGFLSDFTDKDVGDEDVKSMLKLHINLVQFYDWMYRHENLVANTEKYTDLMGKEMTTEIIKEKIRCCHQYGMKAMAYGAVYAASEKFYEQHESWGMYTNKAKPIKFIDLFYIMNIDVACPWHQHIITRYCEAITRMDFDGIHMDTYGYPKSGFSKDGDYIKMDEMFGPLINNTKAALCKVKEETTVIFNNVGNWPVKMTAEANQDILYVEVWEPYDKYIHIQQIIHEGKAVNDKSLIVSAYLKPYISATQEQAFNALALLSACIIANGSTHLIMGEEKRVLTQGYYVDHYPIEEPYFTEIRTYYDFAVQYAEIFYDKELVDVSMTHAYGDNLEYVFEGMATSAYAEAGKVWTIIREHDSMKVISLINLVGNSERWNEAKNKPIQQKDLTIKVLLNQTVKEIFLVSPEAPEMKKIKYKVCEQGRGTVAVIHVDEINFWSVLVIR